MKKLIFAAVCLAMLTIGACAQGTPPPGATTKPAAFTTALKVGDAAPDFSLRGTDGKTTKLSDYRGKSNVVLAFYVFAFTGG